MTSLHALLGTDVCYDGYHWHVEQVRRTWRRIPGVLEEVGLCLRGSPHPAMLWVPVADVAPCEKERA